MSYSTAKGVLSTRTKQHPGGTLADLREQFRKPRVLDTTASHYHGASKRERGDIKKGLDYFVGGALKGRRHDENVVSRTLITLDIEAREGQAQPPSPQDTFDTLEALGAEGWVYTSLSHTPAAPRYRVVLPLGEPLEGDDCTAPVLEATTKAAAKKLGLGPWCTAESSVLSQPMYLPAKLKDGVFWEDYSTGKGWRMQRPDGVAEGSSKPDPLDAIEGPRDPVLQALRDAGHYIGAAPRHPGMHYIRCPWADSHSTENDSKTVYYEAHHDGNPRPACKCMSTSHEELTYPKLVQWLRDEGHLPADAAPEVLDDYEAFDTRARVAQYLQNTPEDREWAWDKFAPVGKVTVLAGPGGVSKSMLMLHLLVYGALGLPFADIKPSGPLRGIYVSYEDDTLELHKRVHGLADALRDADDGLGDLLYDVHGAIDKNLRMFAADEQAVSWLLMRRADMRSTPERTARVDWLVGYLRHARLKVLVLDPVVYTHTLEESSPGDMAAFMQTLTHVAKQAQVAVVVLHHMHKTAQWASLDEINQGSLRGASSFADNSRSVAVMVTLPAKDAPAFGMTAEQAQKVAVLKHVKHNYSASLGYRVFRREGPLLVHLDNVERLSPAEAAQVRQQQKEADEQRINLQDALVVLPWLLGEPGATSNMVGLGCHLRPQRRKAVLEACLANGFVDMEPGPNKSQCWSVTPEGAEWLAAQKRR